MAGHISLLHIFSKMEEINNIPIDFLIKCCTASEAGFNGGEIPSSMERLITKGGPSNNNMPLFFVAKEGSDIYIVVRGATEACDFQRVLGFSHQPLAGGEVHQGALDAARWIISECRTFINECKGRIICTGHSLGAATSSVIAAILRLEENRENVIGITEASFPVFSKELKQKTEGFITSLVNNNDVVPLLTHSNIAAFLKSMVPPEAQNNAALAAAQVGQLIKQLIISILASRGINDPSVINSVGETLPSIVSELMKPDTASPKELLLPGKVFQVVRGPEMSYSVVPFVEGKPFPPLLLMMLGVQDHSLQLLINALNTLAHPPPPPEPQQNNQGPKPVDDLD